MDYVDGSFVTSDAVADALLEMVAVLGHVEEALVVHIPSIEPDGSTVVIDLVVGPASQIKARAELIDVPEPDFTREVDQLKRFAALASPSRPVAESSVAENPSELDSE